MVLETLNGPVRRVGIFSPKIKTDSGVGVGSTARQVLAAYPNATSAPNKYVDGATDLTVSSGTHDMLFEVSAKKVVTGFRIGESEQVAYVESCN
ncbi:MAG: lectin [Actinomycetota bacterium]|nr:lectin [Actinomycetota bacterium]